MEDKEYTADNIDAFSFQNHVRMRPNLYFEECFTDKSLDSLPIEAACHAIDEHFDGQCSTISLGVAPEQFTISYDAGMNLDEKHAEKLTAELFMTGLYACRNHKKHLEVGKEFCKIGIATLNAGMEECTLTTVCDQLKGIFIFKGGETVSRNVKATDEPDSTLIYFKPDVTIFGNLKLTFEGVEKRAGLLKLKLPELEITVNELE
jgi:DNA gyrase/topoisomerase IV subunit B